MEGVEIYALRTSRRETTLSAQVSAIAFYESLGYSAEGDVFEEAGIPHRNMRKRLRKLRQVRDLSPGTSPAHR